VRKEHEDAKIGQREGQKELPSVAGNPETDPKPSFSRKIRDYRFGKKKKKKKGLGVA